MVFFKSEDEIKELWEADRVFEPQMDEETEKIFTHSGARQ